MVVFTNGCASPEERTLVAELQVTASGEYLLQGEAVARESLAGRLNALRASAQAIELTVRVDSLAKAEAVNKAVSAVREAGIARVSFGTSESAK